MTDVSRELSPMDVYESFLAARRYFAGLYEAQAAEDGRAAAASEAWAERRPRGTDRRILEALALDDEAMNRYNAEIGAAYRDHLEAHPIQAPEQPPNFGLRPLQDAEGAIAVPYATVVIAEDGDGLAMDVAASFEAVGNPDAWNVMNVTPRQPFLMEKYGQGTGLAPGTLMAAYHHSTGRSVQWYFLYMPFADHQWGCSVSPWFHGAYRCWAESDWPFTDPWACTQMEAILCLLPFGVPQPRFHDAQYSRETVIDVCGYDVSQSKWEGWLPTLDVLTPLPQHRQKPHWIIFTASGNVGVCGESHAMLDFARGTTSSGSLESGSYRETKYGIYCPTAKILW